VIRMGARPVSFVITDLLEKNRDPAELLRGVIDPRRIAMAGHSFGGYATLAEAGGDDKVCDFILFGQAPDSEAYTCVPTLPDRRIKAIITLDASSFVLHFYEMARIDIPSLIFGETIENSDINSGGLFTTWIARPHAAIARPDSFRMDVLGANHFTFTNYCEGAQVFNSLGQLNALSQFGFPNNSLDTFYSFWPCSPVNSPATDPPAGIPAVEAHRIITSNMIAFLDVFFFNVDFPEWIRDALVLTPGYAGRNEPEILFFNSEKCPAALPGPDYYTYRPTPETCAVDIKDSPNFFGP